MIMMMIMAVMVVSMGMVMMIVSLPAMFMQFSGVFFSGNRNCNNLQMPHSVIGADTPLTGFSRIKGKPAIQVSQAGLVCLPCI